MSCRILRRPLLPTVVLSQPTRISDKATPSYADIYPRGTVRVGH